MKEFHFHTTYELAHIIDSSVFGHQEFWNFNEDIFINCSVKFSKFTLLHLYIIASSLNYYRRYFRKNGDCFDEECYENWKSQFKTYDVLVPPYDFNLEKNPLEWFDEYSDNFENLFEKMAEEVFHILFNNRNFLLEFNILTSKTIKELLLPKEFLTEKNTIKRAYIPSWLKKAAFHRDKGRCVYCNTDLTNIYNTITNRNYDHIVPLDLFGVNDPCNIQLTCERCNKSKKNNKASTSNKYQPWWD